MSMSHELPQFQKKYEGLTEHLAGYYCQAMPYTACACDTLQHRERHEPHIQKLSLP